MTTFWRISEYADLSGHGGKTGSARWHTKGRPIVYLAESPASAMLERIVHLFDNEDGYLPAFYQLLEVSVPESIPVSFLNSMAPVDWKDRPGFTRQLGDTWLALRETPLARVPSAIVAKTWNYLLNPDHPDAKQLRIESVTRERFDDRLFRPGWFE